MTTVIEDHMNIDLRKKTADLRGVADIRLVTLEDGPGRGQRILIARNATGLSFEVAVDRGFDISSLSMNAINIGWCSPTQMPFPTVDPDSENGWGFLRNFDGFMVTCGLDHISRPREVDIKHYNHPHLKTVTSPLHGRIATARARLLSYGLDEPAGTIVCEGIVRQASVFGEVLELRRRITLRLWEPVLMIDDVVTNRSFRTANHAILYHLNFGYPFLDESLEIAGLPEPLHSSFKADPPRPKDDYGERVNVVDSREIPEASPIVLTNPDLSLSVGLSFSREHLTKLAVWRAYQSGLFALGIEPRTDAAENAVTLEPGGSCVHSLRLDLRDPK